MGRPFGKKDHHAEKRLNYPDNCNYFIHLATKLSSLLLNETIILSYLSFLPLNRFDAFCLLDKYISGN